MWSEQEGKCPAGPEHLQKRDECQQERHLEALVETYSNQQHMLNFYIRLLRIQFLFWRKKVFAEFQFGIDIILLSALMIQSSMKSSRWEHLLTSILDNTDFKIYLHELWRKYSDSIFYEDLSFLFLRERPLTIFSLKYNLHCKCHNAFLISFGYNFHLWGDAICDCKVKAALLFFM